MRKILGHESIINGINRRKLNNSFSHANLIVGVDGIGKSVIAKYLSNNIIEPRDNAESVDIVRYYPSSSSFGVDDVRNIIDEVSKKPYEGDKKVLILYKCDKMTTQAQNALLKTIEEPPAGVYLILLSDSLETILDTIQSRCQVYKLTPLSKDNISEYIDSYYPQINSDDRQAALAFSTGIPGKIDKFINDEKLKELRNICVQLFLDILKREHRLVLKYDELLKNFKDEKYDLVDILILFIRDIMVFKELNNKELVVNFDKINNITDISRGITYKKLNSMLEYIKEARINFNSNTNYSMTVSVMLMGFAEV